MILKTQAIVLRMAPYSETSRIVTWLTAAQGRVATIIKGSQRPKSPFLGQYDLFYTCELLFYLRLHQGLHIVKECTPLETRAALRVRWRAAACASYFTHLVAQIAPPYAAQPALFRLLAAALDAFTETPHLETCLCWFELQLMGELGLAPQLNACVQCKRALSAAGPRPFFAGGRGGLLCASCGGAGGQTAERIPPDILNLLRFWQPLRSWEAARRTRCSRAQVRLLQGLLGEFLPQHLEVNLAARALALAVLSHQLPTSP